MKILITGSAGFIGSALTEFLKKKDIKIVEYDIKDNPKDDVRDFLRLKKKISKVDGVIHLAAVTRARHAQENPKLCIETNIGGTANVLEVIRELAEKKRPWLIFTSSREVFGKPKILPATEEFPKNPINVYGVTKLAGEELCRIYSESYGLIIRVLRLANVYTGKNDQLDRVIPKFIIRAAKNEDLVINGKGKEILDFIHITDVIQGTWSCVLDIEKRKKLYDDFNLATGRPTSLKELAEIIIRETKSKSKIKYRPAFSFEVDRFFGDSQKAKKILKFKPCVEVREGIRLAIAEFKKEKIIKA